jgi:excisionase family DNA binding protein
MERFNPDMTLTTTEAAELLAVSPSTVKRWCNRSELVSETTSGGHRRIHLQDVLGFARSRSLPTVLTAFHPFEPHVWSAIQDIRNEGSFRRLHSLAMGWVTRGRLRKLGALYRTLGRDPSIGLCRFLDDALRGLMEQIGDAWAKGRLRVGDEHLVSQVMTEVLIDLRPDSSDRIGETDGTPRSVAVVGTAEGTQHHLGAMSVRHLLATNGWDVLFLGPDVPIEDIATVQRNRAARLVCVSLGPNPTPGDVGRVIRVMAGLYDEAEPYALELGGRMTGPLDPDLLRGPFLHVGVHDSCASLCRTVDSNHPVPEERAEP